MQLSTEHRKLICLIAICTPDPRLELAPRIANYASAAMDISDGLLGTFPNCARRQKCWG